MKLDARGLIRCSQKSATFSETEVFEGFGSSSSNELYCREHTIRLRNWASGVPSLGCTLSRNAKQNKKALKHQIGNQELFPHQTIDEHKVTNVQNTSKRKKEHKNLHDKLHLEVAQQTFKHTHPHATKHINKTLTLLSTGQMTNKAHNNKLAQEKA